MNRLDKLIKLDIMIKRYVKLLFLALTSILYVGCEDDPYDWTGGESIVSASDFEISDVTVTTAKLSFNLRASNSAELGAVWVKCGELSFDVIPIINGRCEVEMIGLSSDTYYDISVLAIVDGATVEIGRCNNNLHTEDLTTLMPNPYSLKLGSEENSIDASCLLKYHESDLPILEVGFFYGSDRNVTFEKGTHIVGTLTEDGIEFAAMIKGLDIDTDYYVGAYVTTEQGTLIVTPQHIKTSGFEFVIKVKNIVTYSNAVQMDFYLEDYPKYVSLQMVQINIARPEYLELYGFPEFHWYEKTGEKEYSTPNFGPLVSKTKYRYWFTVTWQDVNNGTIHETNVTGSEFVTK